LKTKNSGEVKVTKC